MATSSFNLAREIKRAARKEGISPKLFSALVQQESGGQQYRPDGRLVTSSAGAQGLTQLMPGTARDLGVDPTNPIQNLRGGARYFRQQLDRFGSVDLALAAYNAGPGRVQQAGGIPNITETQNYVRAITGSLDAGGGSGLANALNPTGTGQQRITATAPLPAAPTGDPRKQFALNFLGRDRSGGNRRELIQQAIQARQPPPAPITVTDGQPLGRADSGQVASSGLFKPLPTPVSDSSEFLTPDAEGARDANGNRFHAGKDWFADAGTGLAAPTGGKVVEVKQSSGNSGKVYGGVVKVQSANGMVFVFRHVDPAAVQVGQQVRAGDIIAGISAWTGGSPHAHVEVWRSLEGGYRVENMIDPMQFFG